ncbi:MAG: glycerophosphodiester phosphodiesterase [Cytophagales bacterium]|nr:MAG: glycerophosphodiester phosphodiesterase [Cytophagales bacterium]
MIQFLFKRSFLIAFFLIISILIIFLFGDSYMFSSVDVTNFKPNKNITIIAHRGASSVAPENTLIAIKKALDFEADIIEIDVFQTSDSVVILMHDETLDRTTNGEGRIEEHSYLELSRLEAGSWFSPSFAREPIPRLEEVIELINGEARLLIEIKEGGNNIEQNVLKIINQYKAKDWCIVQSFDAGVVQTVKDLDKNIEVHQLAVGNISALPFHWNRGLRIGSVYQYNNTSHINLNYQYVSAKVVRKIHEQGQKIYVWTVNKPEDMRRLAAMGVDGIITDYPDVAKKILKK